MLFNASVESASIDFSTVEEKTNLEINEKYSIDTVKPDCKSSPLLSNSKIKVTLLLDLQVKLSPVNILASCSS